MEPDDRDERIRRVKLLIAMGEEEHARLMALLQQAEASDANTVDTLRVKLARHEELMCGTHELLAMVERGDGGPPDAGMPQPAISPNGPRPLRGGAAAPLD